MKPLVWLKMGPINPKLSPNYQRNDRSNLGIVSFDSKFNFMSETALLTLLAPPKLPPGPGVLNIWKKIDLYCF